MDRRPVEWTAGIKRETFRGFLIDIQLWEGDLWAVIERPQGSGVILMPIESIRFTDSNAVGDQNDEHWERVAGLASALRRLLKKPLDPLVRENARTVLKEYDA